MPVRACVAALLTEAGKHPTEDPGGDSGADRAKKKAASDVKAAVPMREKQWITHHVEPRMRLLSSAGFRTVLI